MTQKGTIFAGVDWWASLKSPTAAHRAGQSIFAAFALNCFKVTPKTGIRSQALLPDCSSASPGSLFRPGSSRLYPAFGGPGE